jgi:hypothetical protein
MKKMFLIRRNFKSLQIGLQPTGRDLPGLWEQGISFVYGRGRNIQRIMNWIAQASCYLN